MTSLAKSAMQSFMAMDRHASVEQETTLNTTHQNAISEVYIYICVCVCVCVCVFVYLCICVFVYACIDKQITLFANV